MKLLFTSGDKLVALPRGINEIDVTALGHRQGISRIAGESKNTVSEGEYHTAVTGFMTVQHICPHCHTEPRKSGTDLIDPHAEHVRRIICTIRSATRQAMSSASSCVPVCLKIIHAVLSIV